MTLLKIIQPEPNSNMTCLFSRCIYILNFNWKCPWMTEIMSDNWKIIGIFLSKMGITLPKINRPDPIRTQPAYKLWHINVPNFNSKCQVLMEIMSGNWKLLEFFISPRVITLPKIIQLDPNSNFNLHVAMTRQYTEFQFKISICNGDNDRKLKMNRIFVSQRGITLPKIIRPNPNLNSTCILQWHINIPNFNSKYQFEMEIMSGNWKLMEFF